MSAKRTGLTMRVVSAVVLLTVSCCGFKTDAELTLEAYNVAVRQGIPMGLAPAGTDHGCGVADRGEGALECPAGRRRQIPHPVDPSGEGDRLPAVLRPEFPALVPSHTFPLCEPDCSRRVVGAHKPRPGVGHTSFAEGTARYNGVGLIRVVKVVG